MAVSAVVPAHGKKYAFSGLLLKYKNTPPAEGTAFEKQLDDIFKVFLG